MAVRRCDWLGMPAYKRRDMISEIETTHLLSFPQYKLARRILLNGCLGQLGH